VPSSHVSWATKLKLTFIKDVKDEDFPIINVGNNNVNPKVVQLPEPNMSVYPVPHITIKNINGVTPLESMSMVPPSP